MGGEDRDVPPGQKYRELRVGVGGLTLGVSDVAPGSVSPWECFIDRRHYCVLLK